MSAVMTAPALTVQSDRPGSEVLLDMLDRGIRHFPVVSASGRVLGIVEDHDLVEVERRSSFLLRRAIARATTVDELVETSSQLRPTVVAMTGAGLPAAEVTSVFSVVADAVTRRAVDLAVAAAGEAPTRFELAHPWQPGAPGGGPETQIWTARSCGSTTKSAATKRPIRRDPTTVATQATGTLLRCGFRPDEHRVSASDPLFVRSLSSWHQAARSFSTTPTQAKALVLVSVLVDSRGVWGADTEPLIAEVSGSPACPMLLRLLAEFAISHKPPTGFMRGLVVESSGEHRSGSI